MKKTVTMAMLAKELGLSESAVSKALNGYKDISPETKRLVREKADELGYAPNILARNLAKKNSPTTSSTIGMVVSDVSSVYGEMFKALNVAARRHDLNLVLYDSNNDPENEATCIRNLMDTMPMGMVVVPVSENIERIQAMTRNRVPVVYLGEKVCDASVNYVSSDSAAGTEMALRHLIGKGHRKIAMLCDQKMSRIQDGKIQVYRELMRSIWQKEQIFYTDAQEGDLSEAGYRLGKRLLASGADFTGLVAVSDLLAIGVLAALKDAGVKVPDRAAVVGYDDINAAALPAIGLTTISHPRMKMAESVIDILRKHAGQMDAAPEHRMIKPELIVRTSTSLR